MSDKRIIEITTNRKARHDYDVLDAMEAGIELRGTEIKAVRDHSVNLKDSYVMIRRGEAILMNMHISPYNHGNIFNHEPLRNRKLLLHKKEILKITNLMKQKGIAVVPLKMYIKGKYAKIEIGIVKGKKSYDKREAIRERDIERDTQRELKEYKGV